MPAELLPHKDSAHDDHPAHRHDWASAEYATHWVTRDAGREDDRRPGLARMVRWITDRSDAPVRVLDIGGGYGLLSGIVLDTLPQAQVVWHDFSEAMLEHARDRLAGHGDRVRFHIGDLTDPEWSAGLDGEFDAVVSALAIHNLFDRNLIARVYRDAYALLRPGGVFLNSERVFTTGPLLATLYGRDSSASRGRGPSVERTGGLLDQLRWLTDAGFTEVDCVVKDFHQAILCGLRGPESEGTDR